MENHKELEKQDLIYQFEILELKKKEEQRLKDNKISEEKKTKN